jgi:hypothetical protein
MCYLPASLRHQGLLFRSTGMQAIGLHGGQCEIVTTEVVLADSQGNAVGPLVMLAKLATVAHPTLIEPLLIGLEFLQFHAALLNIDFAAQPRGEITL